MASLIPFYAPAQTHAKKTLHQGAVRILYRVGIRPKNVNHLREAECSLSFAATNIPKPSETALPRFLSIPRCSSGVFFELFRFLPIRYRPAETTGSNVNPREAAMQQETFHWPHKDLLDVDQLTQEELFHLLDTAANLHEINSRPVKKVPILKGKSVVLFFAEPSTRTKTSFDMAGKRLSADTFGLAKSGSSLQKGESMKDTALTLQAMNPDVIVIRHSSSGAAQFLAERLHCGVVNAGDGWHAHPTQALLDAFSLRQVWGHDRNAFKDKNLLILGDCAHSRVCRSNVLLLTKLGVNVSLCAPRTLLPAGVDNWPVTVYTDSKKAVRDMDAVMCLRLQLERQQAGLLPDLREYSKRFCLTTAHMELARPGAHIMHPGPILRGLDVSDALADSSQSLILDQVSAGVSVRMAVLYLLATRPDLKDNL